MPTKRQAPVDEDPRLSQLPPTKSSKLRGQLYASVKDEGSLRSGVHTMTGTPSTLSTTTNHDHTPDPACVDEQWSHEAVHRRSIQTTAKDDQKIKELRSKLLPRPAA